jgi:elongation factor P
MSKIKAGNIRKSTHILFKDQPHQVTQTQFVSPGKGSAFIRVKLKNIKTSSTQEFTFKSNETVEELDINAKEMQFLYIDADEVVFMDKMNFEQVGVPKELFEEKIGYLIPEISMHVLFYDEKAIGISFPLKVIMKVKNADEATAGNRSTAGKRPVEMETGITIQAPIFIKTGDKLIIDTENGSYVSRDNN